MHCPESSSLATRHAAAVFTLLLAAVFAQDAQAQPTNPPATLPELQQRIQQHISQPRFDGALWGVKIVSLDTGKTVFEHNPQKLCSPASNCKLYTVALALDRLGADYRIKTSLYADARPDGSGQLAGDLILYGRGDPTINARLHGGDIYKALEPLVAVLTNAGVKSVCGRPGRRRELFPRPTLRLRVGLGGPRLLLRRSKSPRSRSTTMCSRSQ